MRSALLVFTPGFPYNPGMKNSSAKVPLHGRGTVRLVRQTNPCEAAGWRVGLKTVPRGSHVKETVDEIFSPVDYALRFHAATTFIRLMSHSTFSES